MKLTWPDLAPPLDPSVDYRAKTAAEATARAERRRA